MISTHKNPVRLDLCKTAPYVKIIQHEKTIDREKNHLYLRCVMGWGRGWWESKVRMLPSTCMWNDNRNASKTINLTNGKLLYRYS